MDLDMMRIGRRIGLLAGGAALALNTACYAYQPVTGLPLAENDRVRLLLTADGTSELARYLGPRVQAVEGTLTSIGADGGLNVAVGSVQLADGISQPWSGEGVVAFPSQYVRSVERSRLNRLRTTVGGVALAAGLLGVAAAALRSAGSQSGRDAGGGSPPP